MRHPRARRVFTGPTGGRFQTRVRELAPVVAIVLGTSAVVTAIVAPPVAEVTPALFPSPAPSAQPRDTAVAGRVVTRDGPGRFAVPLAPEVRRAVPAVATLDLVPLPTPVVLTAATLEAPRPDKPESVVVSDSDDRGSTTDGVVHAVASRSLEAAVDDGDTVEHASAGSSRRGSQVHGPRHETKKSPRATAAPARVQHEEDRGKGRNHGGVGSGRGRG